MKYQKNISKTSATDKQFHDLFHPVAPAMEKTGYIAQTISGLTEIAMVCYLVESQTSSMIVGIMAGLLVAAVLEIGGRKFLQVLTRQVVWRQWATLWHKLLFGVVLSVTVCIVWQSFTLSTTGIQLAFTSSPSAPLDTAEDDTKHTAKIDTIQTHHFAHVAKLESQHKITIAAVAAVHDAEIKIVSGKVASFTAKAKAGEVWAGSHAKKWAAKLLVYEAEKAKDIAKHTANHVAKLDTVSAHHASEIARHEQEHTTKIAQMTANHQKTAEAGTMLITGYGRLLAGVVGICVILAFVCIITVEIYQRGAGIQVVTTTGRVQQLPRVTDGLAYRWWMLLKWFADVTTPQTPVTTKQTSAKIGFDMSVGQGRQDEDDAEASNIKDAEILTMAIKNARTFVAAYKGKNPTQNNRKKLAEWQQKADDLQGMLDNIQHTKHTHDE